MVFVDANASSDPAMTRTELGIVIAVLVLIVVILNIRVVSYRFG